MKELKENWNLYKIMFFLEKYLFDKEEVFGDLTEVKKDNVFFIKLNLFNLKIDLTLGNYLQEKPEWYLSCVMRFNDEMEKYKI